MAESNPNTRTGAQRAQVSGKYIQIEGEKYYLIDHYDAMPPFFISMASDTDLWMYISSTGGLTCGRRNPEQVLFPYYTDDKITENYEHTGAKTIVRVRRGESLYLWEPFSSRYMGQYRLRRSIAKSVVGNSLVFIEQNIDLGLTFTYRWTPAERFGWVRRATLINDTDREIEVELIDGLQNVIPSGVERITQNTFSTLVDAYKKTEQVEGTSLVLFRMEAILVDRAEPSESLRCNTVYTLGLPEAEYMTSSAQLDAFRLGRGVQAEPESKGMRGANLAHSAFTLAAASQRRWYQVCDVMQDAASVRATLRFMRSEDAIGQVEAAIRHTTETLRTIVGQNDGIQYSADEADMARHFANTLFNTMRGGFYCDDYQISTAAFRQHVAVFNRALAEQYAHFFASLPDEMAYSALEEKVSEQQDHQLHRLFLEYLPLTFSRRHGDPSRPWNLFDIRVNDAAGKRLISYQGNWRDIFQNWEALSLSYPDYVNGIIAKFLNATTADGYNPYKVTSEGIDWEVIEPENPWSNIGYWGDHQIIYLCRLLELSYAHNPEALRDMLALREFAFANVPYRFRTYAEIVANPKDSIYFEDVLHKHIFSLLSTYGQDARLILDKYNKPLLVTFTEKVLITLLTKLSNFIPEAGIWMNTLRPEWNDANNALVGYGASMVTLYYIRRFVGFLQTLYGGVEADTTFAVSREVVTFLRDVMAAFVAHKPVQETQLPWFTDATRRSFIDSVGKAGERYREAVYAGHSGDKVELQAGMIVDALRSVCAFLDESIAVNRREDGLYHAYNLVAFTDATGQHPAEVAVSHLYEMLEGQVAILSAGVLSPAEVADLLDALRRSALYREDQRSYMLYPNRRRASFLEKNNLPEDALHIAVVERLLQANNTEIVVADCEGGVHFNASFNNADFLARAIDACSLPIAAEERAQLLSLYERMFCHHAFTGRSGTFYKYEGLGCIYWHMVSKLLLAVGENIRYAVIAGADADVVARLRQHYFAIREGIGAHKSPAEYGSFPFDAYSHTPMLYGASAGQVRGGVQQPGMTGQVKEDILSRFMELGLMVQDGAIHIDTTLLRKEEFADGILRFTYCQTPFEYRLSDSHSVEIRWANGEVSHSTAQIAPEVARHIFARDRQVAQIIIKCKL